MDRPDGFLRKVVAHSEAPGQRWHLQLACGHTKIALKRGGGYVPLRSHCNSCVAGSAIQSSDVLELTDEQIIRDDPEFAEVPGWKPIDRITSFLLTGALEAVHDVDGVRVRLVRE